LKTNKISPTTHPACRSLLQKAIRRGYVDLTRTVINHLWDSGDSKWLKQRAAVITFEECWPLGADIVPRMNREDIIAQLTVVAKSVKVKDAAGLGTLAYVLSNGDRTVLTGSYYDQDIRIVAAAIARPSDFWNWAIRTSESDRQRAIVESAHKAFRGGGWPWDRAFMQAAAYLEVTDCRLHSDSTEATKGPFPFWIAIDKHTEAGRKALSSAAKTLRLPVRQLSWASFYCEGAVTNYSTESPWWNAEMKWRLMRVGLTVLQAKILWDGARPSIIDLLYEQSTSLQEHIGTFGANDNKPLQGRILG